MALYNHCHDLHYHPHNDHGLINQVTFIITIIPLFRWDWECDQGRGSVLACTSREHPNGPLPVIEANMVMIVKILITMHRWSVWWMMNDDDNQRLLTVLPGILVLYALQEILRILSPRSAFYHISNIVIKTALSCIMILSEMLILSDRTLHIIILPHLVYIS